MNFVNYFFVIISLLLLLPGIKIAGRKEFHEDPFSLKITKGIAGYFAFCALIHHIVIIFWMLPGYNDELLLLEHIGVLIVGFFFLFSGYGLIVSHEEKENYLKTFIFRRVCTVLLPFFLCNYAYMTTTLLLGNRLTMKELLLAFLGFILLNDHMWFAVEIMLLYLAFFVTFRYLRSEKTKYITMTVIVLGMITVSFLLGHDLNDAGTQMSWFHGEWWYNTTPLFLLGMLLAKFRRTLIPFAQKYYNRLLIGFAAIFLVLWQGTEYMLIHHGYWTETEFSRGYFDKLLTFSVQLPMVISFEIFLLLVLMKVRLHNKCMKFLGKISLELILLENVFILCFSKWFMRDIRIFIILVLTATVIFATIINKIKLFVLEKKE
nr:acyltransferase [Lachnospiraceae bacterium]